MRIPVLFLLLAAPLYSSVTLPAAFEPNRGQDSLRSDFLVRGKDVTLSLRAGRADFISRGSHIASVLSGARAAQAEPELKLPGVVNYLRSSATKSITGIPTYGRIRYRGVYPGIDLVYYGKDGRVEYDFIVAPGADPNRIRMRYEGTHSMRIDEAGNLVVEAGGGTFRQQRPVIYQEIDGSRRTIAGRFVLAGGTARFALGPYDRSRPLVIDPALNWATYAGYSYGESAGLALDSAGNVYMTGYALLNQSGDTDILVTKLNSSGTAALITTHFGGGALAQFGTSDPASGNAIAVDSSGNIYVTGIAPYISGYTQFPADGTYIPRVSANYHAFVTKLNSSATAIVYSHYFGGSGADFGYGLALDSSNNVYIAGSTTSPNLPVTSGVAQGAYGGTSDAFAAKFDGNGTLVYATYLGGLGNDYAYAIAADSAGEAFLTGSTASSNFPLGGPPFQAKLTGAANAFVTKLAANGAMVYSTYLGGSGTDVGYGIAVDSTGAAYVTGAAASSDFPLAGAYQKSYGGGADDVFVTKLNSSGSTLGYSTYLGGSGADYGAAITLDGGGNVYLTGGTTSTDFPVTNAFQTTNLGPVNAVVAGLNPAGSGLLFSSYLGGTGTVGSPGVGDYGSAIAANCAAGLVVAGTTSSSDFPATTGTYPGGTFNPFIAQVAAAGGLPLVATGGIVNNSTFAAGPVAPGSIVSIFGSGMALSAQAAGAYPLPGNLGGATVAINGNSAPVFYASAGQINIQLPYGIGTGAALATVTSACGTSAPVTFQVAAAAPYLLQSGTGDAVAQNPDFTTNGANNPVSAGSYVTVYLTGIGPVDNAVTTGAAATANPLSTSTLANSATIGGVAVPKLLFLGLAPGFAGLAQANIPIPAGLSPGQNAVVITVGGTASNSVNIYVQ